DYFCGSYRIGSTFVF
nr:immunoglobulin light chain junction region [Macaca mulatta]